MTTNAAAPPLPELLAVSIDQLHEHPLNARRTFHADTMKELAESIREIGIKTPLLVRAGNKKGGFQIIGGHRRYRCAKEIGLAEVPVLVQQLDDERTLELMLIDNLQREGLHELEEAEGYRTLMTKAGYSVDRIAEKVGRSIKYVYDRVKLLQLTEEAQKLFRDGEIMPGHAIILARLTPTDQKRVIGGTAGGPLFQTERLLFWYRDEEKGKDAEGERDSRKAISVRELQAWIDKHVKLEATQADPMLFPETVDTLKEAEATNEKVVRITHDVITPPELQGGQPAILGASWKRADGKRGTKTCDYSVIGMIVIGVHRGQTLRVCVAKKKCATHWPDQVKAARKRAVAASAVPSSKPSTKPAAAAADAREAARIRKEKEAAELGRREAARWEEAEGAIVKAIAAAVKKAPVGVASPLGKYAFVIIKENVNIAAGEADRHVGKGKTAEDMLRYLAFGLLFEDYRYNRDRAEFAGDVKTLLGIDLVKIVNEAAPLEARCRECGCTEQKACKVEDLDGTVEGCSWIEKPDSKTGLGLCSSPACAGKRKAATSKKSRKK